MQPRPRVLAVLQSADLGGAERAALRIAERLPALGFDVESTHIPLGDLRAGAWPRAIGSWPKARRLAGRFDLVLLNGIVTQRLAPAMTSATLVPYVHELAESQPRAWRTQRFWRAAPVVLCACEAVAQRCRSLGVPSDRLRVVYAPVEAVAPAERPPWAGGRIVGFVGRIEPNKGTLDLVRAMRQVDARLVVVGHGSGRFADEVRREAGDAVVFTGPVEDARALMPWFDVLAVPSYGEAFGTVAAEALAAGTPVVATRGGGIEEYVAPGRNGDLVMPGDVEALTAALRKALAHTGEMSEAARADVGRFDADAVAANVADALREALARRAR